MKETFSRMSLKNKIFWSLVFVFTVILFYSYIYHDFLETACEGVRFWDILFQGKIRDFYTQTFLIGKTQYYPQYDFLMYIIFAIWNLPLWIVQKVSAIDIYQSVICLMWMKTMLVAFAAVFIHMFRKLFETLEFTQEDSRLGILLFISSGFFMTSVVVLGQYDLISMSLVALGISYYLKGDTKKFILAFAIAIPLKFFSLLVFVPLVLLKEKKISRVLLNGILVVLPDLILRLLVPVHYISAGHLTVAPGATPASSATFSLGTLPIYADLYNTANIGFGKLFLYPFAEIIFLIFCYAFHVEKNKNRSKWVIYLSFMAYAIQFTMSYSHPYWLLMLVPFMILMIIQNKKIRYINIIVEIVLTYGMILAQIFFFTWCYESDIVNLSFWSRIVPVQSTVTNIMTVASRFTADDRLQDYATGIGLSIFMAGMAVFSVLNCPALEGRLQVIQVEEKAQKWLVPFRIILACVAGTVPLVFYFMA